MQTNLQTYGPRQRRRGLVAFAIVAGICLYASLHPKVPAQAVSPATINHILDATEPLCRALAPDSDALHFAVHASPSFHKNGSFHDLWVVECLNDAGKEIIHVLWDEDNKRCVGVSRVPGEDKRVASHQINEEVALAAARDWVARLNIASSAQTVNAPGSARNLGTSWRVFLRLPDGMASVWVDVHSGDLFSASIRSYPDAAMMQAASPQIQETVPHS